MIEIQQMKRENLIWLILKGRIDSMTSGEIQQEITDLTASGERVIVLDFAQIVYISSAGLRVLLMHQKRLKKVSGELLLLQMQPDVLNVLTISRTDILFQIFKSEEDLLASLRSNPSKQTVNTLERDGVVFEYIQKAVTSGNLQTIGSQGKLNYAVYDSEDVIPVEAGDIQFGTGLATMGVAYDSMKDLFGEAVVLNHSLFYYPAIKNACVDFMLCDRENRDTVYQFFHGFRFQGAFHTIIQFKSKEQFPELNTLLQIIPELVEGKRFGIVLMAESKGVFGMSLKKVPIVENQPPGDSGIFDKENFFQWVDFSVEPNFIDHVVLGAGILLNDGSEKDPEIQQLLPAGSRFHLHGAIFDKQPLNKNLAHFEKEMERIINESMVYKVQHLLGQSRFSNGMIAVIRL